jgi:hypothetical protein
VAGYEAPLWLDRLAGVAWRLIVVLVAVIALIGLIVGFESVILPLFLGPLFCQCVGPIYRALHPLVVVLSVVAGGKAGLPAMTSPLSHSCR